MTLDLLQSVNICLLHGVFPNVFCGLFCVSLQDDEHVRRNFVKHENVIRNSENLEKIRKDRLCLRNAAFPSMHDTMAHVFTQGWVKAGEEKYVNKTQNFTKGGHSQYYRSASGINGINCSMQSNERGLITLCCLFLQVFF